MNVFKVIISHAAVTSSTQDPGTTYRLKKKERHWWKRVGEKNKEKSIKIKKFIPYKNKSLRETNC